MKENKMKAGDLIYFNILISLINACEEYKPLKEREHIDASALWDEMEEITEYSWDWLSDAKGDFRYSEIETGIECDWSRHYESKSVAKMLPCGQWVGWTYWYGGGKHGEPESMDWMNDAYYLDVNEKEVMTTVRTFEKIEEL